MSSCTIKCCKECQERFANCHSVCEKYKTENEQWKENRIAMRKNIRSAPKMAISDFNKICWDRNKNWEYGKNRNKRTKRVIIK